MGGHSGAAGAAAKAFFGLALTLGALTAPGSSRADPLAPAAVDFFFDLVGDRLADAPGADEATERRARLAGVPVRVETREAEAETEERLTAGASGRYALRLANGLTMLGKARVAGTGFADEQTPGAALAGAGVDFRYAQGGWSFGLTPSFEARREERGLAQRGSVLEGRASRALAPGLSLAATSRYRWRADSDGDERRIASGRLGFAAALPGQARLDAALLARREASETAGVAISSSGPSLALALPLGPALDLSAAYAFTAETAERSVARHSLDLAIAWDLSDDDGSVQFSAGYRLERVAAADGAGDEDRHAGAVSFAVLF